MDQINELRESRLAIVEDEMLKSMVGSKQVMQHTWAHELDQTNQTEKTETDMKDLRLNTRSKILDHLAKSRNKKDETEMSTVPVNTVPTSPFTTLPSRTSLTYNYSTLSNTSKHITNSSRILEAFVNKTTAVETTSIRTINKVMRIILI